MVDPCKVNVLVTGGGGYVGSHACVELLTAGYNVIAIDNCCNCYKEAHVSQPESLIRAQIISGRKLKFYQVDLLNRDELQKVFRENCIDCVLHFAALKSVNESCCRPLEYYNNNITGTINLLEIMERCMCTKLIYSSSATVYGDPQHLPLTEDEVIGLACTNPYGKSKFIVEEIMKDVCKCAKTDDGCPRAVKTPQFRSKCLLKDMLHRLLVNRMTLPLKEERPIGAELSSPYARTKFVVEKMLEDLCKNDCKWCVISLRYFNPVGAHPSGKMGEDPCGTPNNLMPYIAQVAIGKRSKVFVYGGDYETEDGTGVRDYIHIMDLIEGHLKALDNLMKGKKGFSVYNLGTGKGFSVLEVIKCFSKASSKAIDYEIVDRRPGDIAACFCDTSKALNELGWAATRDLREMCIDFWRWQLANPTGYQRPRSKVCLLHAPNKINVLIKAITSSELYKIEQKLKLDRLNKLVELKQRNEIDKLSKMREVLMYLEMVRSINLCQKQASLALPPQHVQNQENE